MKFLRENENSLFWHVVNCRSGAVRRLIDAGYDVNERDESGMTALIHAAAADCLEVTKILLEAGADVNLVDDYVNHR